MKDIYDVIIIGGGPSGMCAAIYASRAKINTLVLDMNPNSGALGKAGKIENYPGIPQHITGMELITNFRNQAERFGAKIVNEKVLGVDFIKMPREIVTDSCIYYAKSVIIATGAMGRKPTIKGESDFTGKGVAYCATCDAALFSGMRVAVTGDIGEIFEDISLISKFAEKVFIISNSDKIPDNITEVLHCKSNQDFMYGYQIEEILGDGFVERIRIVNNEKKEQILEVSGVFIYLHGNKPVVDFLNGTLKTTKEGCIEINREDMSASAEGVYAAGDVTCKKIRQAVLSAAEGCVAGLSAIRYVNKT